MQLLPAFCEISFIHQGWESQCASKFFVETTNSVEEAALETSTKVQGAEHACRVSKNSGRLARLIVLEFRGSELLILCDQTKDVTLMHAYW